MEPPRTGRYPRPFSWKTISFLRFLGRRSKKQHPQLMMEGLASFAFPSPFHVLQQNREKQRYWANRLFPATRLVLKTSKAKGRLIQYVYFFRRCGSRRSTFSQHSRWAKQRYSCLQKRREQWSCLKKPFLIPSQHGQMRRNEFA